MQASIEPTHPVHAVSAVCRRNKRFLLIKRKYAPYKNWLSFPGGRLDPGESPQAAARRELYEETGLSAGALRHLVTLDLAQEEQYSTSYFLSVYLALDIKGEAQAADDALSIHWLHLHEMEGKQIVPSVYEIAGQLNKGRYS